MIESKGADAVKPSKVEAARPAEVGGIAGAVGLLIAKLVKVDDPDTIVAIGMVVGFVPAGITYLVNLIRAFRA